MTPINTDVIARRVRAARAYAKLTRDELARAADLTHNQVKSIEDGERTVTTVAELYAIADACDWPRWWMEHGFEAHDIYREMAELFAIAFGQSWEMVESKAAELGVDLKHLGTRADPSANNGTGDPPRAGARRHASGLGDPATETPVPGQPKRGARGPLRQHPL